MTDSLMPPPTTEEEEETTTQKKTGVGTDNDQQEEEECEQWQKIYVGQLSNEESGTNSDVFGLQLF